MSKVSKKIFILLGHPDVASRTARIADAYEAGARAGGHEVRRQNVGEMKFDPILHHGYKVIQELEPDLITFQNNVLFAEHIVIVYPNWWSAMPAILKGLIERAWLPGFAFHFHHTDMWWDALLKGKSARIIILANTHPWVAWFFFGEFANELSRATLAFSGVRPVRTKIFSPSENASEKTWERWVDTAKKMGVDAR